MTKAKKGASRVRTARGSKTKGSDYEREFAAFVAKRLGIEVRRALLSGGGRNDGGMDVEGMPHVHPELKRTEAFSPYAAMRQAEESLGRRRGPRLMPLVVNRRNGMSTGESLAVMRLDDWLRMYEAFLGAEEQKAASKRRRVQV